MQADVLSVSPSSDSEQYISTLVAQNTFTVYSPTQKKRTIFFKTSLPGENMGFVNKGKERTSFTRDLRTKFSHIFYVRGVYYFETGFWKM